MTWYVIVLIASAALFLLTTVSALFFGEMHLGVDTDVDVDGGDFLGGDIFSFKGLLHFAMGFSLTLTLMKEVTITSVCIAIGAGLVFVLVLYFLYKIIYTKSQQSLKYTDTIDEMDAEVYFWNENRKIGEVFISLEGRPVTVTLEGAEGMNLEKGQKIKVSGNRKSVHPVEFIV
ncbi:MAG: hypothetical protein LBC48_05530 [Dysgonamonadaceae bacterium]|jgi:hypothetical protein|nr:hypothetical protein [Dysgonamonadaceae bacterium]